MKDFIFDFETFGTNSTNCAVIDCGYLFFDYSRFASDNPYTFEELLKLGRKLKLDVKSQVKDYGFKIDKSTLKFWEGLGDEVRANIKPKDNDLSVEDFIDIFDNDLKTNGPVKYWWSRSNTFDPIILSRLYTAVDRQAAMDSLLKFYNVRDIRTFIDAKTNFTLKFNGFAPMKDKEKWNRLFKAHDSIHDIAADVLRMQMIIRAENDLEYE